MYEGLQIFSNFLKIKSSSKEKSDVTSVTPGLRKQRERVKRHKSFLKFLYVHSSKHASSIRLYLILCSFLIEILMVPVISHSLICFPNVDLHFSTRYHSRELSDCLYSLNDDCFFTSGLNIFTQDSSVFYVSIFRFQECMAQTLFYEYLCSSRHRSP